MRCLLQNLTTSWVYECGAIKINKLDQIENEKFTCSFAGKVVMTTNVGKVENFYVIP